MSSLISNCPLCEEHGLHTFGEEESQIAQCISCGYVTSTKFVGDKEINSDYQKLTDDMKSWAQEANNSIWIPTIITLPNGMLYPENNEEGMMVWKLAFMVDIPEDERENYPDPSGGFYERRIDTDNAKIYRKFMDGMIFLKSESDLGVGDDIEEKTDKTISLPKIKRI
tara:strand:+ start:1094 stop:1597 length:504 start_codon:yes stop_codon:yes gene_type:complete